MRDVAKAIGKALVWTGLMTAMAGVMFLGLATVELTYHEPVLDWPVEKSCQCDKDASGKCTCPCCECEK
jgi:hypothetical protein